MLSLPQLIGPGANLWLFIPSAIVLGALHGLEPGHSKTMMAAFIVAIRGTVAQAILLGVAAALSHTAVVWAVALGGQSLGRGFNAETAEPYFQFASGLMVIGIACWMIWRTWRHNRRHHDHGHDHDHDHDHGHGHAHPHRDHGPRRDGDMDRALAEALGEGSLDAHEQAHADDIRRRFANRDITTGQIVMFGLTGGLIPCPAAITVLLLCLQLKEITLGVVLVSCFSIGLAVTMVAVGVSAALSVRHVARHWSGLETFAHRAPYASGALIIVVGLYMAVHGWSGLAA